MQISDILAQMGGLQQVASELGVTPQQAQSGAAALLPAILGGFQKQAQPGAGGGLDLGGLLNQLGGASLHDNVLSPQPTNVGLGNNVLGQIFGSKDVSRAVADNAASRSGLDPALLKKMLPILAMLAAGYMAKQHSAGSAARSNAGGGLGGLLGGLLGGGGGSAGGLASLLDANGNGNPLDDILGMLGGTRR
ncbi:MAG: DUF937 domain-containing protein [Steroidobacteraceae bacterium]